MGEVFVGNVVDKAGAEHSLATMAADCDAVGLYFSAHWCGPCRGFTPKLAEIYTDLVAAGKSLEIVFVSSDRDEKSFDDYFKEMPWLALPYAKRTEKELLSDTFGVSGIPSFVVLRPDGTVLST